MLIMTFQHKSSLEQIKSTGRYYCQVDSFYKKETPKIYSYLQELIFEKTSVDSRPIFGWSNLISYTASDDRKHYPLDLFPPSFDNIFAATQKVSFGGEDNYMYILDVPEDLVVHHDFFDFAGFKLDEAEEVCSDEQLKKFIFNSEFNRDRDIQTCFPYIDKSFIKGVYEFELITDSYGVKTLDIKFREIEWNHTILNSSSIFDGE